MPVYKDKERGTWYVSVYYTDWKGKRRLKKKRGFEKQKDAKAWEHEFLHVSARSCDMLFKSMVEIYMDDMKDRLKPSTIDTKRWILDKKILPYFGDIPINEITPAQVRKWQSELLAQNFSDTYVKTIHEQLSAILNYSCRYYNLPTNPARVAGAVGKDYADEMKFWTVEDFEKFIPHVKKYPARVGLSVLFWTGLRIGELLALTADDIDLEGKVLYVRRGFQMLDGKEVISDTKTFKGRRTVPLPAKLCDELRAYEAALYNPQPGDRLFPYTKHYFRKQLIDGCEASGVEQIRLHDLRHSHASLLIHMGYPVLLVKERLGHEKIETTLRTYGHLYPSVGTDVADRLDDLMRGKNAEDSDV